MKKKICIFGAGTYGSYLANVISNKYPNFDIYLYDIGNENIKSEKEIGFKSILTNAQYNASSKGRYFGLGGTSSMWGGQILFFTENDCMSDDKMTFIKSLNIKYYKTVLKRFFTKIPNLDEKRISNNLFFKTGIWLQFNKRNLYNYFRIKHKSNIKTIKNAKLLKLELSNNIIKSAIVSLDGNIMSILADYFYLTCGAFESVRVLSHSKLINLNSETYGFSDHVSTRCFTIKSQSTSILKTDLTYRFFKKSLLTTRIIGDIEGTSFYVLPIYNEKFIIFEFLKNLIFKKQFSPKLLFISLKQFIYIFPFLFNYIFKNKLYIYKDWGINIDIEIENTTNFICHDDPGIYDLNSNLKIDFSIPVSTKQKLKIAIKTIKDLLNKENIEYIEHNINTTTLKLEDTYHPYRLYNKTLDFKERYNPYKNLFVYHTGILDRAGGINPTASIFCLIEHSIDSLLL